MERRITKVTYKKSRTTIEWTETDESGRSDEFRVSSLDAPLPEFLEALQALAEDVVEIFELASILETADDGDFVQRLVVTGVSFTWTQDIMGAVITASLSLSRNPCPANLVTPHKSAMPYSEGNPEAEDWCLDAETVERLDLLREAAENYANGRRAQLTLAAVA